MTTWLARLHFPAGTIELSAATRQWMPTADDDDLLVLARQANLYGDPPFYTYSPADGYPGHRIAAELGERLKADRVEYCPIPPIDPDVVY